MNRLIVSHKDFILKVFVSENNTSILDSHLVKKPKDMKSILFCIKNQIAENYAINKRSISSMIAEWRVHNLMYSLGIFRSRTKHVDLNTEQPWYIEALYYILSPFYLHFK